VGALHKSIVVILYLRGLEALSRSESLGCLGVNIVFLLFFFGVRSNSLPELHALKLPLRDLPWG
jgi:hypothetical protein